MNDLDLYYPYICPPDTNLYLLPLHWSSDKYLMARPKHLLHMLDIDQQILNFNNSLLWIDTKTRHSIGGTKGDTEIKMDC